MLASGKEADAACDAQGTKKQSQKPKVTAHVCAK